MINTYHIKFNIKLLVLLLNLLKNREFLKEKSYYCIIEDEATDKHANKEVLLAFLQFLHGCVSNIISNLAIAHACQNSSLQRFMTSLKEVGNFWGQHLKGNSILKFLLNFVRSNLASLKDKLKI